MKLTPKTTPTIVPDEIANFLEKASQCYDASNKAHDAAKKAMRKLLKGKCFIHVDSFGEIIIGEAKTVSDIITVKGRIITLSTPDGLRLINHEIMLNIFRTAVLKIISKEDFERLYKRAENIISDTDRQINELVDTLDSIPIFSETLIKVQDY